MTLLDILGFNVDITILGVSYLGYEFILITSYLFIPFLYGMFFSNNKSYYVNALMLIWVWLIISYYYNLAITIHLSGHQVSYGHSGFIPISEFHRNASLLSYFNIICAFCSFSMGLLIKYMLHKYETYQQSIIITLTVFAIVIITFDGGIAKAIDESIKFYENFDLKSKASNPSQQEFGIIAVFNYRIIELKQMILLTSVYLTLFGISSSIYIKMKNRKKLKVKN